MENFSTVTKYDVPVGTYLSRYHTWVRKNIYGLIKLGIDEFIVRKMDSPQVIPAVEIDKDIKLGDALFEIKNSNRKLILFSPINCKIKFINPGILCKNINDPYVDDWIVLAVSPDFAEYKKNLLTFREYVKSMGQEIHKNLK